MNVSPHLRKVGHLVGIHKRLMKFSSFYAFRITVLEIMYSIHDELPPTSEEAEAGMFCLKRLPSSEAAATSSSTTVVTVLPKDAEPPSVKSPKRYDTFYLILDSSYKSFYVKN